MLCVCNIGILSYLSEIYYIIIIISILVPSQVVIFVYVSMVILTANPGEILRLLKLFKDKIIEMLSKQLYNGNSVLMITTWKSYNRQICLRIY